MRTTDPPLADSRRRRRPRRLAPLLYRLSIALPVATCLAGCRTPPMARHAATTCDLIWMLPGVEGGGDSLANAVRAFRDAGITASIEIHDWEQPFGTFVNLMSYERNRRDAALIAERIGTYRREHPSARIDLVGYSGGGGMAVMVAEGLPEGVQVQNVLLVQAAVSPDYDLTAALRHVEGKLVNFYSKLDWVILGLGTTLFGTMDRQYTPSAGHRGFTVERAVPDRSQRSRLAQREWSTAMLPAGHWGGHAAIFGYQWNREYVAPWLLIEKH